MRYSKISKRSDKGKLREKIGKLHFQILKIERKNEGVCEICKRPTNQLGRFHIIRVGDKPRLEFNDFNVLLCGWGCCHFPFHHFGANHPKCEYIIKRIKELRGDDYMDVLAIAEKCQPKHDMVHLQTLYAGFKTILEGYEKP